MPLNQSSKIFDELLALVKGGQFDEAANRLREVAQSDIDTARQMVRMRDEHDYDLLCWGALSPGSLSLMEVCVELGANPDCLCGADHVITKLILADSEHGLSSAQEIKYLIERGADPNAIAVGAGSYPLLHFAIRENRLNAARALLESGADPALRTKETDLDAVSVARRYNKRALEILHPYLNTEEGNA